MHAVFVACLLAGGVATALFLLLGVAGGAFGHAAAHGANTSAGHAAPAHVHATTEASHHGAGGHHSGHPGDPASWLGHGFGWTLSWLSPLALAAAAVCFGAIGLVTETSALSLVFAVVAGVLAILLVRTVMNAFVRASVAPLRLTGEGAIGTINASIPANSTGEVLYTLEGLHRTAPARYEGGRPLRRGTDVVIVRRENGIAWVEPLDPLTDDAPAGAVTEDGSR